MDGDTAHNIPSELSRLRRFTAIGIFNTGVDLAVFSLLRLVFEAPLLVANSAGFSCAVTCGFFLNRRWTFADRRHHQPMARQYLVFLALAFGGLTVSNAVVWWLSQSVPDLTAKLASFVFIFAWNYTTSRLIVFRRNPDLCT
ncbi:MAG: GtrA family protein [Pseudomonadota bacterium]